MSSELISAELTRRQWGMILYVMGNSSEYPDIMAELFPTKSELKEAHGSVVKLKSMIGAPDCDEVPIDETDFMERIESAD